MKSIRLSRLLLSGILTSLLSSCSIFASGPAPTQNKTLENAVLTQQISSNFEFSLDTRMTKQNLLFVQNLTKTDNEQQLKLSQLSNQLNELKGLIKKTSQLSDNEADQSPVETSANFPNDKIVLGEVESSYIEEFATAFNTRVDTGAESSSLDAHNIQEFERDGNKWVRFDVFINGKDKPSKSFESRVFRYVLIKQRATKDNDRRPVIRIHLKIGQFSTITDLNLTDRSQRDYPLLLGRKFIRDIAIVDVGQRYIHGKFESKAQ